MTTVVNTDPTFGINFQDPFLLQDIIGAAVTSHGATQVDLHNTSTGDTLTLTGNFTAFNAAGQPTEGALTGIDAGGLKLLNMNIDVMDVFSGATTQDLNKFLADAFGGDDSISTSSARDSNYIAPLAGNDTITATNAPSNDTLFGGDGNDSISGGTGFNRVNGNKGDDTIVGHSATGDWLLGGQGDDRIDASGSSGHNIVNGNLGADTVIGGDAGNTLRGGQGDDLITGGVSADWISGDLGSNTITGGGGADTFHAGAGHDLINDFNEAQGDRVLIDAGVTFQAAQVAGDVQISLSNGGEMSLHGVALSSLGPTSGWILQA